MLERIADGRHEVTMMCLEDLVPSNHLLRKIEKAVDFNEIYPMVEKYYCEDNGRPAADPVMLVKMVMIQHLFGIRSLRQTVQEIEVNLAYRWFLGLGIDTTVPHFATVSYAFAKRFPLELCEGIFAWILDAAAEKKYIKAENVFIDGTHIKASANKNRKRKELCKRVFGDERKASLPYKSPMTKDGFFKKYEYVYDEYYDCILCPNDQILKYTTTNRDGYREYKSNPKICVNCPLRSQCTESANCQKVVTRHVWEDWVELAEDFRHTPEGRASYKKRKETIERVFADAKEKHAMRYTHIRGLTRVKGWVGLKFAAMNLKKMAIWAAKQPVFTRFRRFLRIFDVLNPLPHMRQGVL